MTTANKVQRLEHSGEDINDVTTVTTHACDRAFGEGSSGDIRFTPLVPDVKIDFEANLMRN